MHCVAVRFVCVVLLPCRPLVNGNRIGAELQQYFEDLPREVRKPLAQRIERDVADNGLDIRFFWDEDRDTQL